MLLAILMCSNISASAQSAVVVDSLGKTLDNYRPDAVERIGILMKMSEALRYSDGVKAKAYLYQALDISEKNKHSSKTGTILASLGEIYYLNDVIDSALFYLKRADAYFSRDTSPAGKLLLIGNRIDVATVQMGQGKYRESLDIYIECIRALNDMRAAGKNRKLSTAYFNAGIVYNDLKDFTNALKYHQKALKIARREQYPGLARLASIMLRIGDDFNNLNLGDSAYIYINKAREDAEKANATGVLAEIYGALGKYYRRNENAGKAIECFSLSLRYAGKSGNDFQKANVLGMLAGLYKEQGDYRQSYKYLLQVLPIARSIGHKIIELKALKELSSVAAALHRYEDATSFYREYVTLSDSLDVAGMKLKINEIENKYQTKQRADSILVLRKNTQLQELALRKKQNQSVFTIVGASLLLLAAFLLYHNLRSKHRLLKKTEQLQEQQITRLEKEHQLIAAQSVMKGQEEERSRLAKDLHDGVGGLLSGVKLSLSNMKGNVFVSEQNANSINTIIGQLDNSINELRRVSHNMMPEALIKYGLKEAIENYCESIDQSGTLEVRLQTYGLENRMPQDTEIILYRIIQELLNNVIKHAEAKQALVQLMREVDKFSLTVEDDGKGFDINNQPSGAGLQNIKARAGYLHGIVDIRTKPREGTSITIEGNVS